MQTPAFIATWFAAHGLLLVALLVRRFLLRLIGASA